ncbi:hypothetical protein G6F33_006884 [Rhizopus arrhizus]|uniref:Pre-rRNA processing protein n=1 Tax=Rhizopus oryzae TaxID=64495 RepID=A0A9P7BUD7_RHIOR|nr:hypothetical protein G6F23_003879 [Rhizopus arrhizus]KAG0911553.1 hypothetical protein G6F33_006884 [Rhizopus arrhizus]KAG1310827.1 hypothetical protein G6F64_004277 [Rhizopus arrhizus]
MPHDLDQRSDQSPIDYGDDDARGHLRTHDILEQYSEKPFPPPQRQPFYKKKKYWIICSVISVIIIVVVIVLILYVIFPKIAQTLMNNAGITVNAAQISFTKPDALAGTVYSKRDGDDLNSTFYMNMDSSLSNTGPFSASIKFHNPVEVYYNNTLLGDIYFFNDTHISTGHGSLNAVTPFTIKDVNAFAAFSKQMLAVETFTWTLKGKLDITALSRTATVDLNKDIVLNGMNGFPNVKISSFKLPADAPNGGGILVELGTVLTSPSPIGVQLGTINMGIGYEGVSLGTVTGENVNLQKGDNTILLKGTLTPHNDTASLDKIGHLFSNYIAGVTSNTSAVGISCAPDGVHPITWLSEGFQSVQLNVALGAPEPLKIIHGVKMGYVDLAFDAANPYSPTLSAPSVTANFQMPFGFSLNITELSQNISLGINTSDTETTNFAVIQAPLTAAVSNQAEGTIVFPLNNRTISGIPGQESIFNEYTYELTASQNYPFMVSGSALTKAITPIGPLTLTGINFTVPTALNGLQFLNSSATTINSLDVVGGTSSGLNLAISVTMNNPSDFSISTGDVSFDMGASDTKLGLVTLSNLNLVRGSNTVNASAVFDPKSSEVGQTLLSTFVMGSNNDVDISGYADSTNIASLATGLSAIRLMSTLPGLKTALIQGSALSILPDTVTTSVSGVKVSIANPFSAGMSISKVVAAVTYQGMPLGNIDQDISSNPIVISGKSTVQSNPLNMQMNLEPSAIALLLRTLAVQASLDTKPLDALYTLGGLSVEGQQNVEADSSLFSNFNISQYTMDAMKALKVDLSLTSGIIIGQYTDDLSFSQSSVAVSTDSSVCQLIPIVGYPIVVQIVAGSILSFDSILLSSFTDGSFNTQMKGSITKTGPMDATISFPKPLTVAWRGLTLGTVTMSNIQAKANAGASFDVQGTFTVANADHMATFAAFMINNENFEWEITSDSVSVTALGFTFDNVPLHKFVTLGGSNGFKNAVTVRSFDLPSKDPEGGITLIANTEIYNPGQIGFDLSSVTFESFFKSVDLGPLSATGNVTFSPKATSAITMKGRLVPQEPGEGINAITQVFGNYLANKNTTLTVKGVSGSGPRGEVSWLSTAFKTLTIENVVLPGPGSVPVLIPAIQMNDMQLDFTKDPWAPPTSSNSVQAQLKNPFGFPLGVSQLSMEVQATYGGETVASLSIPNSEASTSATGVVTTKFSDIPFKVASQKTFMGFVQLLTLTPSVSFGLKGQSNAVAQTPVGTLTLPNVPFDVTTSLNGFNDFGGVSQIQSLKVVGGTSNYILIDLSVQLSNPSNITITVGDINFDVVMPEFSNAVIGKVYLTNTVIPPGAKNYDITMHLGEGATNTAAVMQVLSDYLTAATVPMMIVGSPSSTKIAPLAPALASVKLASSMTGIKGGLVTNINVTSDAVAVADGKAQAVITLYNPLDTPFQVTEVHAAVTHYGRCGPIRGQQVAVGSIDYVLPSPLTVPAKSSIQTPEWPVTVSSLDTAINVMMDSINLYNVTQNVTVTVGDGYQAKNMYYYQDNVPYSLWVSGLSDYLDPSTFPATCAALNGQTTGLMAVSRMAVPRFNSLQQFIDWYKMINGKANATASAIVNATSIPVLSTTTVLTPISTTADISTTTVVQTASTTAPEPAATTGAPITTEAHTTTEAPKTTAEATATTPEAAKTTTEAAKPTTEAPVPTTTEASAAATPAALAHSDTTTLSTTV